MNEEKMQDISQDEDYLRAKTGAYRMAELTASLYKQLKEGGFPPEAALDMTNAWFRVVFCGGFEG